MQYISTENILIKLTYYDETKKMAHDSQIPSGSELNKASSWATLGPAKISIGHQPTNKCF